MGRKSVLFKKQIMLVHLGTNIQTDNFSLKLHKTSLTYNYIYYNESYSWIQNLNVYLRYTYF